MKRAFIFLGLLLAACQAAAAPPQPPSPTYTSVVAGSPTGGHKGNGSINAQTYYQNGTLLPPALPLAGGTLIGKLTTTPSTSGSAGFNVPPGIVPASPVDGDMWSTPAGYFVQVNGATVGPLGIGGGGGGGNVTNSGTPAVNQLAQWVSTTAIRGINLNAGVQTAIGNPLNAGGGLVAFSLIGTSGATIPLLSTANTWSGVQSFNDGTLFLKGSGSVGSVIHAPSILGGQVQLPAGNVNLGYQVGVIVDQHCLKASGAAGGFADAGALCGSGAGGITQLTGDVTAGPGSGSVAATVVAAPLGGITGMGTSVRSALAINIGTVGAVVLQNGALGTPSSGNGANLTNIPVAALTGVLPVAKGGSGTAVPSLVGGGTVTVSGSWPNQTVTSTAGGGTLTSLTAGTSDLLVNSGTCSSGACTVSTQTLLNTQTGSSYAILSADNTKIVEMTNAAATTMTIAGAGSSGFGVDWGATVLATLAPTTITVGAGTICGLSSIMIPAQTPLSIASDNLSNYVCALAAKPSAVAGAIPLPAPGTSATLVGPLANYVCTSTCTVTLPLPVAGFTFCIMNDDNVSTVITLAALGSSGRYENTARTAYGTATTGTLVSGGAAADMVCVFGRDSTHYLTTSFHGTWTAS